MADYVSNYSGDQIDEAVGRAMPGGALDTGKAPAGFGYGGELEFIGASSATETMETYCAKLDSVIATMPNGTAKQITATPPETYGAGRYIATIYRYFADFVAVVGFSSPNSAKWSMGWRIVKTNNVWQPFEWENPPMVLGVEYRTTERYLGKPVYAKLVDCGKAGAGTASAKATTYKYGIAPDATDIVGWNAVLRRKNPNNNYEERRQCPVCDPNTGASICYTDCTLAPAGTGTYDGLYAITYSHADLSAWTVYLYVKYTKG